MTFQYLILPHDIEIEIRIRCVMVDRSGEVGGKDRSGLRNSGRIGRIGGQLTC
jgi:hypothetical protein